MKWLLAFAMLCYREIHYDDNFQDHYALTETKTTSQVTCNPNPESTNVQEGTDNNCSEWQEKKSVLFFFMYSRDVTKCFTT